jgi:YHS domain-containing protein
MIRIIVLFLIGYLGYRALKNWLQGEHAGRSIQPTAPATAEDEMVKDPVCNVYVARQTGVRLVEGGREVVFCSDACKDRYLEEQRQGRDHS